MEKQSILHDLLGINHGALLTYCIVKQAVEKINESIDSSDFQMSKQMIFELSEEFFSAVKERRIEGNFISIAKAINETYDYWRNYDSRML